MKRILLCLMMLVSISAFAQNTVVHIVQKGETLKTIAKKYKTSVDKIRAGNPEAKSDIYVGMRLEIPTKGGSYTSESTNLSAVSQAEAVSLNAPQDDQESFQSKTTVTTKEDGLVGGQDYTFMLNPDNKTYGLRMNVNAGTTLLGMTLGFKWQAMSHGSYGSYLGIGLSPKYAAGPILMGFHIYPYVSLLGYDELEGFSKYDVPMYKDKTKVSYGGACDLVIGIKLLTTKKGKGIYLTGSYAVDAPEFKTKGAFKNGLWGVGVSITEL